MFRVIRILAISALVLGASSAVAQAPEGADGAAAEAADQEAAAAAWIADFEAKLDRRHGDIALPAGGVTLHVPEDFYYLDPEDTTAVLVDAWGNPPDTETPLGMLFPAAYSPLDEESWGVIIRYEDSGHISDKDAAKIDYEDLMRDMRRSQKEENADRKMQGYEPIEIVGCATSSTGPRSSSSARLKSIR